MRRSLSIIAVIMAAASAGAASAQSADKSATIRITTETDAKAAIEANGYKSVSNLRMGADGKWSGSAMRDNQQVAVSVDADGTVASR